MGKIKTFMEYAADMEQGSDEEQIAKFAACLLSALTHSKTMHLNTNSYAKSTALVDFYAALEPLATSFAEAFLSDSTLKIPVHSPDFPEGSVEFVDYVLEKCDQIYDYLDPALANIVETIMTLCKTTIYKLENLK